MESSTPLVSVVTPFYNTDAYLEECIASVVGQTYTNWEYVLLNNCSTDNSVEIAERYARQYPGKIRLEHNSAFLSQVQNYNAALRLISLGSKYCKVVQADDWIFPDCVRSMVEVAEAHPAAGIVSAYQLEGSDVRLTGLPYPSHEVCGKEACRLYFFEGTYLFGTPTSVLLRSELVRSKCEFYDERYAPFEDGHACFDALKSWNLGFVHQILTFSRRDNDSILSKIWAYRLDLFLHLCMLVCHGRNYLNQEEYARCLKKAEREYFVYLGKAACARRQESERFWEFHRKGLASIGYSLDWRLLAKHFPRAVIEKAWERSWAARDKATS